MTERSVLVRIRGDVSDLNRALEQAGLRAETLGNKMQGAEAKSNLLVNSIAALSPAIVPLGVQAVPLIAGLSAQLGVAAGAAGVALLAFHGVGDALKALNTYQVTPTTANLVKLQEAMAKLGPAGRDFVHELDRLEPVLHHLQNTAQAGLFPGLTAGIHDVLRLAPQVNRIVGELAVTMGNLAHQAGAGLAGPQFRGFFDYVEATAKPLLAEMGHTLGQVALGFADLLVAFAPLEREFSHGFHSMALSFAQWATGLDKTQGFQDFIDYVKTSGPQVLNTLESLGHALVEIGKAVAPLGGPVLHIIQILADAIASIASSPLGTPLLGAVVALNAFKLAMRGIEPLMAKYELLANGGIARGASAGSTPVLVGGKLLNPTLSRTATQFSNIGRLPANFKTAFGGTSGTLGGFGAMSAAEMEARAAAVGGIRSGLVGLGKGAAGAAALAIAMSGVADKAGLANTATLGLTGTLFGPWGAATGAAIGLTRDFAASQKDLSTAISEAQTAAKGGTLDEQKAALANLRAQAAKISHQADHSPIGFLTHPGDTIAAFGAFVTSKDQRILNAASTLGQSIDAQTTAAKLRLLADGFHLTAAGAKDATQSAAQFDSETQLLDAHLSHYTGLTAYHAAISDLQGALQKNGKTLDATTRAGQANRDALAAIASAAVNVAKTMGTVERIEFMAKARRQFVAAAEAAGLSRKAAERLATELLGLSKITGTPHVDLDSKAAETKLSLINTLLSQLDGTHVVAGVTVTTNNPKNLHDLFLSPYGTTPSKPKTPTRHHRPAGAPGHASGGLISGPGGPRDDLIPAWLSNGEYVVNAYATARNRAALEQMNSHKYATGGYVTHQRGWSQPSLVGVHITGTLQTPFGPAQVRGVVAAEKAADHHFDRAVGGMKRD